MPDRKTRTSALILEAIHAWLLPAAILVVPYVWFAGDSAAGAVLHTLPVLAAALASAFAIKRISHLAVYLLAGAGVTAAVCLLPLGPVVSCCAAAASAVLFLGRIPGRIAGEKGVFSTPNPFCLILFAIPYCAGLSLKLPAICEAESGMAFFYILSLLAYTNLVEISGFLVRSRDTANVPGRQIRSTNRILMGLFLGVTAAAMLIFPAVGLDRLIVSLGRLIYSGLRAFFSLFRGGDSDEDTEEILETQAAAESSPGMPEAEPAPAWLQALYNVLSAVITIAVIVGLVFLVVSAVIELFRRFYRPAAENGDVREDIGTERPDSVRRPDRPGAARTGFFSRFTPEASIRRIYIRAIEKGRRKNRPKENFPESATPERLEDLAGISEGAKRDSLHSLYEKARYSGKPCTREDLEQMRKSAE